MRFLLILEDMKEKGMWINMIRLKKIVVLVIMALMVTLCACGNGGGDSTDSGQTDVQLKDIRETVDVSSIGATSPKTIYDTEDELVFYVPQGIFFYDKGKNELTRGFTLIDEGKTMDVDSQGEESMWADCSSDMTKIYIFPEGVSGSSSENYYYIYNVEDGSITKKEEAFAGAEKFDREKQENGWNFEKNGKMLALKELQYKSQVSGKTFMPFADMER